MKKSADLYPKTLLLYSLFLMVFAVLLTHPIAVAASLIFSHITQARVCGKADIKQIFKFDAVVLVLSVALIPLFVHRGTVIIAYLPWRNPLTAESFVYALSVFGVISSVMSWSRLISNELTSEKITCAIGKTAPTTAMIISLVMRMIPSMISKFKEIYAVKKLNLPEKLPFKLKIKLMSDVFFTVLTWALDGGADTVMSIRARTYKGIPRSFYKRYKFKTRDGVQAALIIAAIAAAVIMWASGAYKWNWFIWKNMRISAIDMLKLTPIIIFYALYLVFCLWEGTVWKKSKFQISASDMKAANQPR